MKKIFILCCFIILSCSDKKSSVDNLSNARDLEDKSLKSGVVSDSLNLGFYFGMDYFDYKTKLEELSEQNKILLTPDSVVITRLETENYLIPQNTSYFFENGKLYRCVNHIYYEEAKKKTSKNAKIETEIIEMIEKKYGKERHNKGLRGSKYYWLEGNKRIDFYDTLNKYIVSLSDIRVERLLEEKINKGENKTNKRILISSISDFKGLFNSFAKESNSNLRIKNIKVEESMFTYMVTPEIAVIGQMDNNSKTINSIAIIGQGNGKLQSGLNLMVAIGGIINSTNPTLTPNQRGDILRELGIIDDNTDLSNLTRKTTKNGILYTFTKSEAIGITFSADLEK